MIAFLYFIAIVASVVYTSLQNAQRQYVHHMAWTLRSTSQLLGVISGIFHLLSFAVGEETNKTLVDSIQVPGYFGLLLALFSGIYPWAMYGQRIAISHVWGMTNSSVNLITGVSPVSVTMSLALAVVRVYISHVVSMVAVCAAIAVSLYYQDKESRPKKIQQYIATISTAVENPIHVIRSSADLVYEHLSYKTL